MRFRLPPSQIPCPFCGEPVHWYGLSCRQCGAPNDTARQWLEGAAVVAVLLLAIGIGLFIATRQRPSDETLVQAQPPAAPPARTAPAAPVPTTPPPAVASPPAQEPSTTPPAAQPKDFAWLERAMSECEQQAQN